MTTPDLKALREAAEAAVKFLAAMQTHLGPCRDDDDEDEARAWDGYDETAATIRALLARLSAAEWDGEVKTKAAENLCRIYFDIAAECIGEDEVRRRRDTAIAATQEGKV